MASDVSPNCERRVPPWTSWVAGRSFLWVGFVIVSPLAAGAADGPPLTRTGPWKGRKDGAFREPRPFSPLFYVAASRPAQMTTERVLIRSGAGWRQRMVGVTDAQAP